jgi:hypothetical protein
MRRSLPRVLFQKFLGKHQRLRPLEVPSHARPAHVREITPSRAVREWAPARRLRVRMLLALADLARLARVQATTRIPNVLPATLALAARARREHAQADQLAQASVPAAQVLVPAVPVVALLVPAVPVVALLVPVELQALAQVAVLAVPVAVPVLVLAVRPSLVAPVVAVAVVVVVVLLVPSEREASPARRASLVKKSAKRWTTWRHQILVASSFRAEMARPLCAFLVVPHLQTSLIASMPKPPHSLLRSST